MTRARNIAGFSTITTTPSPVHVGPIGVLTATRIDGEFNKVDLNTRELTAQGIGVTNLQVSGITTGLNVSGIITAQNGINFNGTSTGLNVSGIGTIATLSVTGNATIAGVLTYEDVTRVDSVGVVTARGLSIFGNTTGLNATGVSTFTGNVSMGGGNLILGDSGGASDDRLTFGAGTDLSLYHNGSHSYIDNSGGSLFIKSSNQVYIQDDQGRKQITCVDGAAVELYHAGVDSVRLQTTTTGVSVPTLNVTGISTFTGNVFMPDNAEIRLGASGDLQIFHHSSTGQGRIYNSNAAGINIISDITTLSNNANNETLLKATNGGAVELYYNNAKTFETTNEGATFDTGSSSCVVRLTSNTDAVTVLQGFNSDFNIKAPSGGALILQANASEDAVKCVANGAVELYNNGTKQCQTFDGGLNFQDSKKAEFGNSGDLKIFHESNISILQSASLPLAYYANTRHHFLNGDGSENLAVFNTDGGVDLYHNGTKKFDTVSSGIRVHGSEGADAQIQLLADEGDDNADYWRFLAGTAGQLDIANYSTGSWINHMTISGSGYVRKHQNPGFRAGRGSSAQSVSSGSAIIFNTTSNDNKFNTGGHYSTSTGKFTVPVTGIYTFFTHVLYQGMSDGDSMIDAFHIYVNSNSVAYSDRRSFYKNGYTGDGGYYGDTASFTGSLTAGQEVWVRHNQGSRTVHANVNYTTFQGHMVS